MTEAASLTLLGCRLPARSGRFDVRLRAGCIEAIVPVGAAREGATMALHDRLLLPAGADGHIHLDKSFIGLPWRPHVAGAGIAARIAAERAERAAIDEPMVVRARRLIARVIGTGTLALRSHVDIDPVLGLSHVEALLALRQELAGRIDIQFVAFPQGGLSPAVAELMQAALAMGVDAVGGLDPAGVDGDIDLHLNTVFALAERHGSRIDIHLHDGGLLGTDELRRIAARSAARGMQGMVAVSHAFALGMVDDDELARTAAALAEGGVAIMTNGPGPDAMPPVARLAEAGVVVFGGSDNIRDAWSPFGDGDLLRRAGLIGYRAGLRTDDELRLAHDMVTRHSRSVMGLEPVTLQPGSVADLIALHAEDVPEAVASAPAERIVFRRGQVVAGVIP